MSQFSTDKVQSTVNFQVNNQGATGIENRPVPLELENARPSTSRWKRFFTAFAKFSISEMIKAFRSDPSETNHAHIQGAAAKGNYLPLDSPQNDVLKKEWTDFCCKGATLPENLRGMVNTAIAQLRSEIGAEYVPVDATLKTLFTKDELKDLCLSTYKSLGPEFTSKFVEYGRKCNAQHLSLEVLTDLAKNANPSFELVGNDKDIFRVLESRYAKKWEDLLSTAKTKADVQAQLGKMPDLVQVVRIIAQHERNKHNGIEEAYNSLAQKTGLPLDVVKKELTIDSLEIGYDSAFADFRSTLKDPAASLDDIMAKVCAADKKNFDKFINRKLSCINKLAELKVEQPKIDIMTKCILRSEEFKDPKYIEECVKAMPEIDITGLLKALDPKNQMPAEVITVNYHLVGKQVQDALAKVTEKTVEKSPGVLVKNNFNNYSSELQSAMKALIRDCIEAANPDLMKNFMSMPVGTMIEIGNQISKIHTNEKTHLNDSLYDLNDLNKKIKRLNEQLKDNPTDTNINDQINETNNAIKTMEEDIKRSVERKNSAHTSAVFFDNAQKEFHEKFVDNYFSQEDRVKLKYLDSAPKDILDRLDGVAMHGDQLFNEYGTDLSNDDQTALRIFIGTLKLGRSETVSDEVRNRIADKALELKNQAMINNT